MTNTTTSSVRFTLDFAKRQIVGTKASFDKASKGVGPIYEELAAKMAAHPEYTFKIIPPKSNKEREVYTKMDITFMRDYIEMVGDTEFSVKFEKIIAFADVQGKSKYPLAKKYFLKQYKTEEHDFKYAEVKELVENYRINKVGTGLTESALTTEEDTDSLAA